MKRLLLLLVLLVATPLRAEIYDIGQLDLKRYHGRVVYLDFWASWCKPCRKSFPWMNQLLTRYPADKFTVLTVNLDAESESMHAFLQKVPARFDIFHDPSGAIAETFKLEGMPTSYLIDKTGKVVKKHIGFLEKDVEKYETEIEELL